MQILKAAAVLCAVSVFLAAQEPQSSSQPATHIRLVYQEFDPLVAEATVPESLRSQDKERLWIVQFAAAPTNASRAAVRGTGAEIHGYLPDHAYVLRMDAATAASVTSLRDVRWLGRYHPAFRLEPALIAEHVEQKAVPPRRYNLVVVDKLTDKPALAAAIRALGGTIDSEQEGSILMTVSLTGAQLLQTARLDQVLWIDRWSPPENDMDNARIQGGGNYVEAQGGYTGTGVNAHIYEGLEATHPDFTGGVVNVRSGGGPDDHGHATAGIVWGNGSSNPAVRGMAPDCGKFHTQYSTATVSRFQTVGELVNLHSVSHTTASWGDALTRAYTSISADADDIVFSHDMPWTQSQSNAGNQDSRPQAWAKNVISIGAVQHLNNSNAADDSWNLGNGSTGPAADGRIKPVLCAYYDATGTSDRTGIDGYSTLDWYASFGGTSGATPIVAGHNVLAIQMFTDGIFGNTLRVPGGTRHQNRPHFTTLEALQIVSAKQYAFTAASADNRREHQGWGFPNLQRMYDNRAKTLVVDETEVLEQGDANRWLVVVGAGETELKVCMAYADPAANPSALKTRINDLSLRVTSPLGVSYWGNNGLSSGNYSQTGGAEDATNTIECVFVQNPTPGVWFVDVRATLVAVDSHVETPAVDADYGLVVSGGTGTPGTAPVFGTFATFGQGCPGSVVFTPTCPQLNAAGGTLSGNTSTNEYAYRVPNTGTTTVLGFDIFLRSSSGSPLAINAYLYANNGSGGPASSPIATTTLTAGGTAGFCTATLPVPVNVTGDFFLGIPSAGTVLSQLSSGSPGSAFFRSTPLSGGWGTSTVITRPSWRVNCNPTSTNLVPKMGNVGVPVLGTSFTVTMTQAAPVSAAFNILGFSDDDYLGTPLPVAIPGAPGCSILAAPDSTFFVLTSVVGDAGISITVPNDSLLLGLDVFHQWLVFDAVNALGVVTSNGGHSRVGSEL